MLMMMTDGVCAREWISVSV